MAAPTLAGFIEFIRNQMGITSQYIADDSPDISTAYDLSKAQVNRQFACLAGNIYALMVYNLAADILINIAQDYSVAISTITWLAGTASVTTVAANTFLSGQFVTISGAFPVGYNTTPAAQVTVTDSTHFTYSVVANPGAIMMGGKAGFNLFSGLRDAWKLGNFVGGTVASTSDESTSESLAVPDAIKQATLNDLQLFKTTYGRWYLSYAQRFGTNWGIS